jgi:hypothetical protein
MKYNIFNSIIWKSKINYLNKNELIKTIEQNYKKNPNQTPKEWKCMVHSSFKLNDNQIPTDLLKIIENKSNKFLDIYEKQLKIKGEYYINNIWYNAYGKHQFQEPHIHGDSLFSGCYYLKFNKNIHHQTTFYNPNFNLDYSKLKGNSYFCFNPDCEEDDIIFFPSFLKHGTQGISDINAEDIRITISFNITNSFVCYEKSNNNIIKYS